MEKLKKLFRKPKDSKHTNDKDNSYNKLEDDDNDNNRLDEQRADGEDVREWIEKYTEISESYDHESTGRNTARLNESAHFSEVFTPRTDDDDELVVSDLNEEDEKTLERNPTIKYQESSENNTSHGIDTGSSMISPRKEHKVDTDPEDSLDFEERYNEEKEDGLKTETAADQRDALSPKPSLDNGKMATGGQSADNTENKTKRLSPLSQSDYDKNKISRNVSQNSGNSERGSETLEQFRARRDAGKSVSESTKIHEQEKSDLVQGFILEKGMLIEEHEREKQRMLLDFMKEKRNLLKKTKAENDEIEAKQQTHQQHETTTNGGKYKPPVLIQVDHKIITPEEFLSGLELDKKHEREKEDLERSFREERINLKEKLELDFEHKLLMEKRSIDSTVEDMKREIDRLNYQKDHLEERIRYQGEKLELEFDKERAETEREFCHAHDALRREMEFKFDQELIILKEEHDKIVKDLQENKSKNVCTKQHYDKNTTYDFTLEVQKENSKEMEKLESKYHETKKELRRVTKENDTLNHKINILKREGPIEEDSRINLKEFMEKEYENRIMKLVEENEELSQCVNELVRNKDQLVKRVQNQELDDDRTSIRLSTCEKLLVEMEQSATVLRKENEDLSLEINCLRDEKQELMTQIGVIRTENSQLKMNVNAAINKGSSDDEKCTSLEKELLNRDTAILKLNQNIEDMNKRLKDEERLYAANHEELLAVRRLLETEKSENRRLNERYRKDAAALRKKDNELNTIRTSYEDIKTQLSFEENKLKLVTEKLGKSENETTQIRNQLIACEARSKAKYDESNDMNNRFAHELNSRVEFIKSIYEKETNGLKTQIQVLRNRTAELEDELNASKKKTNLLDPDHSTRANAVIERLLGKDTIRQYSQYSNNNNNNEAFDNKLANLDLNGNSISNHDISSIYRQASESDSPTDSLTDATSKKLDSKNQSSINGNRNIKRSEDFYLRAEISCDDDQGIFMFDKILERVDLAEKGLEKDVLHDLLREVKSEVNGLNEMLSDKEHIAVRQHSSRGQITAVVAPMELPKPPLHSKQDLDRLHKETEATENYFHQLGQQGLPQTSKVGRKDSKEAIHRLYMENLGLHEKLYEREKETKSEDLSYQELIHKRLHLEKLVSRLQTKLNERDKENLTRDGSKSTKRKTFKTKRQRLQKSRDISRDDIV